MSWREARRIAGPAFTELAFQAIYGFRQGNILPPTGSTPISQLALRRVAQSKLLVSAVLGLLALGSLVILGPRVEQFVAPQLDRGLYVSSVLGAVLLLEMALLWWNGLQVLPTLLASGTVRLLETLPVDESTLRQVTLLLLLRLFDGPVLTCLLVTPVVTGLALSSPLAGLALIPGVLVVVVLSTALALRTGEFFVRHVAGAPSGPGHAIVRWGYLILWAVPAFAMYGFLAAAPAFLGFLEGVAAHGTTPTLIALLSAFPIPFGALAPLAAGTGTGVVPTLGTTVGAVLAYLGLAGLAVRWLETAPLRLLQSTAEVTRVSTPTPIALRTGWTTVALIQKDLRIASRVPAYAFVILLPLLDAVVLGLLTVAASPGGLGAFNLGVAAVTTAALLATFFGPALFAIELMGFSYSRALPISDQSLVFAKVALVGIIFLLSAGIVSAFTLLRVFDPGLFLAFIAAELPAVVAASLLEFGLLFHQARRRGLPIVNLYSGAFWATAVAVPGVIVAAFPIAVFESLRAGGALAAVALMAGTALVELGVVGAIFARSGGRIR
jgi:predicted permease